MTCSSSSYVTCYYQVTWQAFSRDAGLLHVYRLRNDVHVIYQVTARLLVMEESGIDKNANIEVSLEQKVEPPAKTGKVKFKKPDAKSCRKIIFVIISIATIFTALALITITVMTALATKIYDVEQSSRLVGMVVLAATAAITISVLIYSNIGMYRNLKRPLHAMRLVLIALVLIQVLVASFAVTMSASDKEVLSRSLQNSFKQAKENNQRHVKLWSATQSELNCCGIFGAEDYRNPRTPAYFPPNIPISCCPSFDRGRSPLVQEKVREICRAQRSYHGAGCLNMVIQAFQDTAFLVLGVAINKIIFEILCVICSSLIIKKNKETENSDEAELK